MREQERTTAYRRGSFTSGRKRQQKDPLTFVLSGQVAVCLLFVLLAFVLRDAQPSFWQPMLEQYIQLLTRPMQSEEWGWSEGLGQWYTAWRDRTLDAVSAAVQALTGGAGEAQPVQAPAPSEPDAVEQTDLEEFQPEIAAVATVLQPSDLLDGAGGWFGNAAQDKQTPASCSMSPILLSKRLDAPVSGRTTSLFGWREHPITGNDDFHRGLDIAAPSGTRVATPLAGTVAEVGESSIYGNFVTVDHGGGLKTTYAHCDTIEVEEGAFLRTGETVATVGNTGISTGPHLHFEINKDGIYYNPLWGLFAPELWRDVRYGD